jgi:glycosyltransferase involved in cell wall biosynthesis
MRILFLTDNFPPEGNAPATRTYEHAVRWVSAGHEVTVITGAPNFPEGVLFPGYRNAWYGVEDMDGIRVVRVKTYITANEGFLRRTLDYMSFMASGFLAGLFESRPDVVIGTSPQFFTVCAAWVLSVFRRRPFVFELRDLWPASIKAVGAMREGRLLRALEGLELFLYRRAAAIVTVTETFKRELVARGIDGSKIHTVINGVDLDRYSPRPKDPELTRELGLEGKLVVAYVGTHGMAHALHRVLEAAEVLRAREDIAFLFVGSGAQRDALVAQGEAMGLPNVSFVARQPKEAMPRYWSLCDVSLVHLKDDPLFRSVIPSKIFESMGMGLPILLAQPEGEAAEIVRSTGAGDVVRPEQPAELAAAVEYLADDGAARAALAAASAAAARSFSRDRQAERMLDVIGSFVLRPA